MRIYLGKGFHVLETISPSIFFKLSCLLTLIRLFVGFYKLENTSDQVRVSSILVLLLGSFIIRQISLQERLCVPHWRCIIGGGGVVVVIVVIGVVLVFRSTLGALAYSFGLGSRLDIGLLVLQVLLLRDHDF